MCVNISTTRCDLTRANISAYGSYGGSVMAALGGGRSGWVDSNTVSPDMDSEDRPRPDPTPQPPPPRLTCPLSPPALIGPPNVTLLPGPTTLEVVIRDPEFAVSTLKGVYAVPVYSVTYWRDGQADQVTLLGGGGATDPLLTRPRTHSPRVWRLTRVS